MRVAGISYFNGGKTEMPEHLKKRLGVTRLYLGSHTSYSETGLEVTERHYDLI